MKAKLILVAGPSSSGKSTLAQALYKSLGAQRASLLSLDHYYHDLRHLSPEARALRNFDEPSAWESERMITDMQRLVSGAGIEMPQYDFSTHLRVDTTELIQPTPYIIAEGIFALCYPRLNAIANLRIFVDIDDTTALQRRLERDIRERGRSVKCITRQFNRTVRPANQRHIRPSANNAQIVLDGCQPISTQLQTIAASHWDTSNV
ncbi:uridine kinase [Coraliomargarita sp. SDUM461004]|uniref:uridine/cytidine kinase n=1 Tax=Thalassobacterium sedimentorum TaxID=3041258 RepID=A0ABU1AIV7_9BACT|nr:uridine kinase [Coraliomargarita sp. SDUM461004]MDQ8193810.1 uridine kinase [Coraliomargarita sp. SDUM461004]